MANITITGLAPHQYSQEADVTALSYNQDRKSYDFEEVQSTVPLW